MDKVLAFLLVLVVISWGASIYFKWAHYQALKKSIESDIKVRKKILELEKKLLEIKNEKELERLIKEIRQIK